jgi:hypothetical protein
MRVDSRFREVGSMVRCETQRLIVGYTFDLRNNILKPEMTDNPDAGRKHEFCAYRLKNAPMDAVSMRPPRTMDPPLEEGDDVE